MRVWVALCIEQSSSSELHEFIRDCSFLFVLVSVYGPHQGHHLASRAPLRSFRAHLNCTIAVCLLAPRRRRAPRGRQLFAGLFALLVSCGVGVFRLRPADRVSGRSAWSPRVPRQRRRPLRRSSSPGRMTLGKVRHFDSPCRRKLRKCRRTVVWRD
jgi:hypothetical protein